MQKIIGMWGNSLALRIPKGFATTLGFDNETTVELVVEDDKLVVKKSLAQVPTLDELLSQVSPENVPGEFDFGPRVGREAW